MLQLHGIIHSDNKWCNMLWDDVGHHLVVVDLEDVKWLKRPHALEPASGNTRLVCRVREDKSRQSSCLARLASAHDVSKPMT